MQDAGIVRQRGKIVSVINNARRALELRDAEGAIAGFVWRYEPGPKDRPKRLDHAAAMTLAKTAESTALSKELKKRGFKFCGPTIVYAFAQAVGIVNDHLVTCPRHASCSALVRNQKR
mgnify:FL=1